MDRKKFIQTAGRSSILIVMLLLTGFLIRKHKVSASGICNSRTGCYGCQSLPACNKRKVLKQLKDEKR